MNAQCQTQAKGTLQSTPSFTPVRTNLLQRKCACGGTPGLDGECAECRKKRLQRRSTGQAEPSTVPSIVHDVLRSPGQPLDASTRAFMEPRFGHDFSRVRVHADAKAAESARAVHARAYTLGRDVAFGVGQYAPETVVGKRLLAHELTHVVQQAHTGDALATSSIEVGDASGSPEQEADVAAARVMNGSGIPTIRVFAPAVQRLTEPYITRITVNLTPPQHVTLDWKGTPPAQPGTDSFTCSTGKGYSDPIDSPGTCTRDCCSGADVQCAPPYDRPNRVGSCCTPVGDSFYTGRPRPEHNGWLYWTPVEPIHTSGGRGIALHQHSEVTGKAIGHGCIRMDEANAHRIFLYSRRRSTNVTITGRATVHCPSDRQCGATGALEGMEPAEQLAAASLTRPDEEDPGGGGSAVEPPAASEAGVLV
jgi:hypothetical protein